MEIDIFLILGILGMVCILYAFLMDQMHKWSQDELRYDLVNFIGSALLVIYAWQAQAWPFLILNGIWGLYSLKDVIMDLRRHDRDIS